jgi:arylamine N-acetyltransferase
MTASVDVGAYLGRIEWTGAAHPTFRTLAGLVRAHMSNIPFENLDVLLGRRIRLDFSRCVTRRALSPERDYVVDFEVGNHYTSTHPDSPFVNRIMMRALMADGRVTVMDRDVTKYFDSTSRK